MATVGCTVDRTPGPAGELLLCEDH